MQTLPRNFFCGLALVLLAAALPGCEKTAKPTLNPPFYVPSAAFAAPQTPLSGAQQLAYNRAEDILPASEADSFYAPRGEPIAYGQTFVGGISAFTDYTYEAQRISTPGSSGWRYRYVVRQGVSFP